MERAAEAARAGDLLWFSSLPADQIAPLLQVPGMVAVSISLQLSWSCCNDQRSLTGRPGLYTATCLRAGERPLPEPLSDALPQARGKDECTLLHSLQPDQ